MSNYLLYGGTSTGLFVYNDPEFIPTLGTTAE